MKPTCKLCEVRHWTYEEHTITSALGKTQKLGADVLGYEKRIPVFPDPNPPESVTTVASTRDEMVYIDMKTCNTCNKPLHNRGKVCNACRQKAYRERSINDD